MNNTKRFDPARYLTTAIETRDQQLLQMAYNLIPVRQEELPVKSEIELTIDQELVDLDNLYQSMHDIDCRLKAIAHEGTITELTATEISEKYPGVIVTNPTALEGRTDTAINLVASVENLNRMKLGMLVGALVTIIGMLLTWIKRKGGKTSSVNLTTVNNSPKALSGLIDKTRVDLVQTYKTYLRLKDNNTVEDNKYPNQFYLAVGRAMDEILGPNATLEQVTAVFSGGEVTYASIFANSGQTLGSVISREILMTPDSLVKLQEDSKFLETGRHDFKKFVDDCAIFSNEIPRWIGGLKDNGGVGKDGRTLSPETKINVINLDVVVNMAKTLGLALDQPTREARIQDARQFITINKEDMNKRLKQYRVSALEEGLSSVPLGHLNDLSSFIGILNNQQPALLDWKKQIRSSSSKLGNMSRQLKQVRSLIEQMPRDASLKIDELDALAEMVVSNFSSLSRYLVTTDQFNTAVSEGMEQVVVNINTLNKLLNSVPK